MITLLRVIYLFTWLFMTIIPYMVRINYLMIDVEWHLERRIYWDHNTSQDVNDYIDCTTQHTAATAFPHEIALCDDANCSNPEHIPVASNYVCQAYASMSSALIEASTPLQQTSKHTDQQIPRWTNCCKEVHNAARDAFLLWRTHNSPKHGMMFENMRLTKTQFKYILPFSCT